MGAGKKLRVEQLYTTTLTYARTAKRNIVSEDVEGCRACQFFGGPTTPTLIGGQFMY